MNDKELPLIKNSDVKETTINIHLSREGSMKNINSSFNEINHERIRP